MLDTRQLVEKLWDYCVLLRDDGVSVIDYTEQLTYLLFLKMAHERENRPMLPERILPANCSWQRLLDSDGSQLEDTYKEILETLSKQPGILGVIFRKAQNKIQDPAKLKLLVSELIDKENWSAAETDIKGDAYEGLLAKGAEDTKSGAGQYFTPRPLISAIVSVMRPTIEDSIVDPACGTGGFLLAAHEYVAAQASTMTKEQRLRLQKGLVAGTELVDGTARLAAMNMLLHGAVGPSGESPIEVKDALSADPGVRWSIVLANPPFGRRSAVKVIGANGDVAEDDLEIVRDDFWATTKNKQLNFLQHIKTILDVNGRAAVILPDNVLFESGAGEVIRRRLLSEFDVHTLLRLPTGIFYRQGVKANVLFFDKKPASKKPWTSKLWVYDFRTNVHFTLKERPLTRKNLDEFVDSFCSEGRENRVESERFKSFTYEQLIARENASLDIFWLKNESIADAASLPSPAQLALEMIEELESAIAELTAFVSAIGEGPIEK